MQRIYSSLACIILASFFLVPIWADPPSAARNSSAAPLGPQSPAGGAARWKFTKGDVLFYQLVVEKREIAGGKEAEVDRRTYEYAWHVLDVDAEGVAKIGVAFQRVQAEITTPTSALTADTAAPVGQAELSRPLRNLQNQLFRELSTPFLFHTTPRGEISAPAPEYLPPRPDWGAEVFTTGELPVFAAEPIGANNTWSIERTPLDEKISVRTGKSDYRLFENAAYEGRPCWKIEGETRYKWNMRIDVDLTSDPHRGTYYFDASAGRLLASDEQVRYVAKMDGRSSDTSYKNTRRLLAGLPKKPSIEVTRRLGDGRTRTFTYTGGMPPSADDSWASVVRTSLLVGISSGTVNYRWGIFLQPKQTEIVSIDVYDVTESPPVRVVERFRIDPDAKEQLILTPINAVEDPATSWLVTEDCYERIFRVDLIGPRGQVRSIYQPVFTVLAPMFQQQWDQFPEDFREKYLQAKMQMAGFAH